MRNESPRRKPRAKTNRCKAGGGDQKRTEKYDHGFEEAARAPVRGSGRYCVVEIFRAAFGGETEMP